MLCHKCGYDDVSGLLEKRVERGASQVCQSCRAKPELAIKNEFGVCIPHQGDFDADDNPLDKYGRPVMPGFRKCGHSDCIAVDHVLTALDVERYGSFRDGKKLSPAEFMKRLWKELR